MGVLSWIRLIASATDLTVAIVAILRGGRSPLALPLAFLGLDLFAWNIGAFLWATSGVVEWHRLEMTLSPLTMPFLLHFVLAYVGRRRRLRALLVAAYSTMGLFAAVTALSFVSSRMSAFAGSPTWAVVCVALTIPLVVVSVAFLVAQLRAAATPEERARGWLLLLAIAFGVALASSELLADVGFRVPRLSSAGTAVGAALIGFVALRYRLFEHDLSLVMAVWAMALATLGVLCYLAVFRMFQTSSAILFVGTASVTLGLLAAMREIVSTAAERRGRSAELATLGRLAAQMAHDLKNPLAALKGSAQFLQEERARGRSIDDQTEFLQLMAEQIDRMQGVVDEYQRLARVEPVLAPITLGDVVRDVVGLARLAPPEGVAVTLELDEALPPCLADRMLLSRALENLVRNALEAMPRGGALTVSTGPQDLGGGRRSATVVVRDTGVGMDARVRERAFDDFYTTKASGGGLGLAFVRRVMAAHKGDVTLDSRPGRGTVATLRLPAVESGET